MITEIWENLWLQTSPFKKFFMFRSSATNKQMLQRNVLLRAIQIVLWIVVAITVILWAFYDGNIFFPGVALAITIRFEFWAQPYWSWRFSASGQSWVVTGIRDNPVYQTKFFTMRYHCGEACPLW